MTTSQPSFDLLSGIDELRACVLALDDRFFQHGKLTPLDGPFLGYLDRAGFGQIRHSLRNAVQGPINDLTAYAMLRRQYDLIANLASYYQLRDNSYRKALSKIHEHEPRQIEHLLALAICDLIDHQPKDALAKLYPHYGNSAVDRLMASCFEAIGQYDKATTILAKHQPCKVLQLAQYHGSSRPVRVLTLESLLPGNLIHGSFLKNTYFDIFAVYPENGSEYFRFEDFDVIFNVIGDADLCQTSLHFARDILQRCPVRIINHPDRILKTGRLHLSKHLEDMTHIRSARVFMTTKDALLDQRCDQLLRDHGISFPLLLRAPGYSHGAHFHRVDHREKLTSVLDLLPGQKIFVMEFLDTMLADGTYHKYRVVCFNGKLYPIHLTVSKQWKIHYFNVLSEMMENEAYRRKEAHFLEEMDSVFTKTHQEQLLLLFKKFGLEYIGADFCLDSEGSIVIFEVNANMSIHSPPADPIWNYRQAAVIRAQEAAAAMVIGS